MFFLKIKRGSKLLSYTMVLIMTVMILLSCKTVFASDNVAYEKPTTLISYSVPNPKEVEQPTNGRVQYEWSDLYSVKVRPKGASDAEWEDLAVFKARVQNIGTQEAAFVYFDCDGPIEVQVTCNTLNSLDDKTVINPASENVLPEYAENSNVISFTAEPNQRLVVDPNGDTRHSLHVYANKLLNMPDENDLKDKTVTYVDASKGDTIQWEYDTDVVYVKNGFYNNSFSIKSNQTWYIDGGAVIRGSANLDNTKNAKLIGHGVFYRPDNRALSIDNSEDTYIEGVIVSNYGAMDEGGCLASVSNSKNITIKNIKSIACNKWSDAIDIFTSQDVTIEDCFIRSGDDAIALYGPRWNGVYWGETGNVRNINVSGCVLMPDRAHPIYFAVHGDGTSPNGGRVFDNFTFKDLDFLTYNTFATDSNGGMLPLSMGFNASEGNMITNVYFDDIRIQDAAPNHIFTMNIATSGYGSGTIAGRGINNVYFKDVKYTNPNSEFNTPISGYSATQLVQNITFENLTVNGKLIASADEGNINIGNYVKNIKFVKSGEARYRYNSAIVPEDIWPEYYDYAQCKGVNASALTSENNTEPKLTVDGDENTVWYSNIGTSEPNEVYTKIVNGEATKDDLEALGGLTIDLGSVRKLHCIRITWEEGYGYKYRIFASKDGNEWGAKSDEQVVGALNPSAKADYIHVKWNWLANQRDSIEGRYVKIIPCSGYQLKIAEIAVLGDDQP